MLAIRKCFDNIDSVTFCVKPRHSVPSLWASVLEDRLLFTPLHPQNRRNQQISSHLQNKTQVQNCDRATSSTANLFFIFSCFIVSCFFSFCCVSVNSSFLKGKKWKRKHLKVQVTVLILTWTYEQVWQAIKVNMRQENIYDNASFCLFSFMCCPNMHSKNCLTKGEYYWV